MDSKDECLNLNFSNEFILNLNTEFLKSKVKRIFLRLKITFTGKSKP